MNIPADDITFVKTVPHFVFYSMSATDILFVQAAHIINTCITACIDSQTIGVPPNMHETD